MGRHPSRKGRDIHGILLCDKPSGISSNHLVQKIKRIFNANKAGHTGALDPLATGMLPVCLGEATKFSQFLLNSDKCYRVVARLGQRTNTSDAEGELIEERPVKVSLNSIDQALSYFRGNIDQIPSMYSALKYQGKPLYEYARQGIDILRNPRQITVHQLTLIRFLGNELELDIHCSKGTYIRTIIDDLGELLGCGAHVTYLRRRQVANYPIDRMITLEHLNLLQQQASSIDQLSCATLDTLLMPIDSAVQCLDEVNLSTIAGIRVRQGQTVQVNQTLEKGMVRITIGDKHVFIGIGDIDEKGRVSPRRLIVDHLFEDKEKVFG